MFNKLKKKMVERSNKRILEYVLNNSDIWLEVLRIINNRYEGKIFRDIKIERNRFNHLKLNNLTILGGIYIKDNIYIPKDDDLKDKNHFIELSNNDIKKTSLH